MPPSDYDTEDDVTATAVIEQIIPPDQDEGWLEAEESDDDETSSLPLTLLTSGTHSPLTTTAISHVALLPEYPRTSQTGYTFCVYIDPARDSPKQVLQDALEFQYCRKMKGPAKRTTSPFMGAVAFRYRYECTGIKHCEYLDNRLATLSHTYANAQLWDQIQSARMNLYRTEPDPRRQRAIAMYQASYHRFRNQTACVVTNPNCKPVLKAMRHKDISGTTRWYIGCAGWSPHTRVKGHFFRLISDKIDVDYLQFLFANGLAQQAEQLEACGNIYSTRTKFPDCDTNHPQGKGKLLRVPCGVRFDIIIPLDITATPYYTFTSTGVHVHPPPPPTKTPARLTEEIISLIRRANDPGMTVASFLKSPFLEELCQKYNKPSFQQIHASLSNMDKPAMIIYRQKLLMFPHGQDIAGVEFEFKKQQGGAQQYIQEIYKNHLSIIVLCMLPEQATIFSSLTTFRVDVSFKRVGFGFQEMLFAYFHERHGKLMTLARVFINSDRTRTYYKSFQMLFRAITKLTGREIRWKHLHNNGIIGVTVDMDGKQMTGLGKYLRDIDPNRRPWQWQLQNTVKFCEAHFLRSIIAATGPIDTETDFVRSRMRGLLTSQSYEEYVTLCQQLIEHETTTVGNWARHKLNKVIAAGLNKNITLMPFDDWKQLEATSNHVEQAAKKGYAFGKGKHLLGAVLSAQKMDQRDIDQWAARNGHDIRHSQRSTSQVARYQTSMARQKRKRSAFIETQNDHQSDCEEEDEIIYQATSSRIIRPPGGSKRRQRSTQRSSPPPCSTSSQTSSTLSTTGSQPVPMPLRTASRRPTTQHKGLDHYLDDKDIDPALKARVATAKVKAMELDNVERELRIRILQKQLEE
ncbi:hypothetical protein NX059_012355 [Plenodomus lindquistii]|nr:hypothetical protein NX059_012355 [Plenodomus lindquistii]